MKTYDFVHLVLNAAGGHIEGRTKLQKMVYFAGVLTKNEPELGYRAHFYGPYSSEVAAAVDKLRALNFLQQTVAGGGLLDRRGFEVARFDYQLTDDGKLIAEEKAKADPDTWKLIKAAVNRLVKSDSNDYVKLSIAAKAFFLRRTAGKPTSEDLTKISRHFGWDVSQDEYDQALDWLKSIRLTGGS
jgi:uncharacterized protein YwgA